jgi:NAD(P)-dependent dehydrogenase (short-subunit alcohol dehydrogenase family)
VIHSIRSLRGQILAQGVMQIRFDGKTVVVSGAGHGLGRCIAETFAGLGARVFGCDLAAAELAETAKAGVSTALVDRGLYLGRAEDRLYETVTRDPNRGHR